MKKFFTLILGCTLSVSSVFSARQMENLNRGVHAVKTDGGVFVSWRFLGTDAKGTAFNVYRDGVKVNNEPITGATNLLDAGGSTSSKYIVKTLSNGKEIDASAPCQPWAQWWKSIQLKRPSDANGTGATYTPNDMSCGDVDGDGEYELIVKWDPNNSKDNSQKGKTGTVYLDCYKLDGTFLWRINLGKNIRAGAHYTQFQVYDYDGDGKAEVACKTAPGSIDGKGKYILMGNDSKDFDGRNSDGYVLSGSEYLTIFNGETGAEIHTVAYNPARGSVNSWGDKYGNRVDRFLACTAYLDGEHPSLVMCRGYYTRSTLCAYDFKNGKLVQRWFHDSPTAGQGAYAEGYHNLSVADVDNDGFDEIIYGSATIDHDGKLLFRTGRGHGDAMHVSRMFPNDNDFYGWFVHEEKGSAYGYELRNLRTNQVVFGAKTGTDNGRGFAADVDPTNPGFEFASAADNNYYNKNGEVIGTRYSVNFRLYWDGDLQDEIFDGQGTGAYIAKYNPSKKKQETILSLGEYGNGSSCNTTKSTPCLTADLFGDWREEVVLYDANDPSKINIYTTTALTEHRLFTPMHDYVYRLGVAWQNTAYNQPPHLSNYIGDGTENIPQPDIYCPGQVIVRVPERRVFNRANDNSDWADAANWIGGIVPTSIDTAEITNGEVDVNGSYKQEIEVAQSGKLRVRGNSSFGNVSMMGGGISVASGTLLFELSIDNLIIANGATVTVQKTEENHLVLKDGAISGAGTITKSGVGVLDVNMSASGFEGIYVVSQGTLSLNADNSIGQKGVIVKSGASLVNNARNESSFLTVESESKVVLEKDLTVDFVNIVSAPGEEKGISAGTYTSADYDWIEGDGRLTVRVGVSATGCALTGADRVVVYPNPASDVIWVETQSSGTLYIYDANGRMVLMANISKNSQVNVSALPVGVYRYILGAYSGTIIKR